MKSYSDNTIKGYESDWNQFQQWVGNKPITVDTVCEYLKDRSADLRGRTLTRHLSAIRYHIPITDHPKIWAMREELERQDRLQPANQPTPIDYDMMIGIATVSKPSPKGIRDLALMFVMWHSSIEREALVQLKVPDVAVIGDGGWSVTTRIGREIDVRRLPRTRQLDAWDAIERWRNLAKLDRGLLFRRVDRWGNIGHRGISGQAVSLIVKDSVRAIGFNPDHFSSNSLRSGRFH